MFQEEYVKLKLKLSAAAAYRVYDEFDHYEQQEDGSFIAEINYPKGPWIFTISRLSGVNAKFWNRRM